MKVAIVGTGYVGLVAGVCFAEIGIQTTCIDVHHEKIKQLKKGISPIYEPQLDDLLQRNIKSQRLHFSTSLRESIHKCTAVFIAVDTPPKANGSADITNVLHVAAEIAHAMTAYLVVVMKSTAPVGTCQEIKNTIFKTLQELKKNIEFDVVSNPEFLKEGSAISDFMNPNRIVVGVETERAKNIMDNIYKPFQIRNYRIIYMDIASSELSKYAANTMLALRISFMNEIANLCEKTNANIHSIRKAIGTDERIGDKFLYAGIGYGGSCFPKDVRALVQTGKKFHTSLKIAQAIDDVNQAQKEILVHKLKNHFKSLKGKTIAIWGLSYKPNTDDTRESPAFVIIDNLLEQEAIINVYDPEAQPKVKLMYKKSISYFDDCYDALQNASAVLILTEWRMFRILDVEKMKERMKHPVLFDGRNIYSRQDIEKAGFTYYGIGC